MTIKTQRYFLIVLLSLLTACGQVTPPAIEMPSATQVPATETVFPLPTVAPTISVSHLEPTSAPFVGTPSASTLPKFPMDGYVMTFAKDGYLYFQDEENTPVQLAPVDEEAKQSYISDDNQKVVFHGADGNIYSINSDGSQKQVLISKDWKDSLKAGMSISIDGFVPDSHQIFFRTNLCESSQEVWPPCSTGLFLADADTDNIKNLADLGLASQLGLPTRNIRISPNGKMIAIGNMEHMDILDMDGNIIRQNILTYKPSTTRILFPSFFWLPDSSGLTIALPDFTNKDGYLAYSIWRYTIENQSAVQIALVPTPLYEDFTFDVSPDGNWIVYGDSQSYAIFLGNLVTEQVSTIMEYPDMSHFSWSSDSNHFLYGGALENMATVNNPLSSTSVCGDGTWVDASHFTCIMPELYYGLGMAVIKGGEVKNYTFGLEMSIVYGSVFIKPK